MIVDGTLAKHGNKFISDSGAPRWDEAMNYILRGGLVYLNVVADEGRDIFLVTAATDEVMAVPQIVTWLRPIVINGTVESGIFHPDSGEMSWNDAKSAYDDGREVYLSTNSGIYDKIVIYNYDFNLLKTETGIMWVVPHN